MSNGMIRYGVNSIASENFDGRSLQEVIEKFRDTFNLPRDVTIKVNGSSTSDTSRVIKGSDNVEFIKRAGDKGSN